MSRFHDHFSGHATDYSRYRPRYPAALYKWLAAQARPGCRVWDCATGNGQAAVALAEHFPQVFASDASAKQVQAAEQHPRVTYGVQPASESGLEQSSVGLVTIAQALHWFDFEPFFAEVERVLEPDGLVAAWCYELFTITGEVDAPMLRLYNDILAADWPSERRHIETGYADVPWPWPKIDPPEITMTAAWTVEQTLGYLRTWSATQRWAAREGEDPVALVEQELRSAWGDTEKRTARWPLKMLASRPAA